MDKFIVLAGDSPLQHGLGITALAIFLLLVALPDGNGRWERPREAAFFGSIFFLLFAIRWPILKWPYQINIDESQFVACAVKTTFDWVPWRGVDGGTSGPLNSAILAVPALFGLEVDLFSARMTVLVLLAAALCALYCALKWIYAASAARIAIVAPVVLLSLTTFTDFVHCTSEHLSICLTTIAIAAAAYLAEPDRLRWTRLLACAIAGLCVGSSGFAKLQSVPLAAAAWLAAGCAILVAAREKRIRWQHELAVLTVATATVPTLILVTLWLTGGVQDALISYIQMGLVQTRTGAGVGAQFFFSNPPEYAVFLEFSIVAMLLMTGVLYRRTRFTPAAVWSLSSSIILLVASLFAIYHAHRGFPHYLLFSILPVCFFIGNLIGLVNRSGLWPQAATLVLPATFFLLMAQACAVAPAYYRQSMPPSRAPELDALLRHTRPGDRMGIWCWKPEYYVYTRTVMATRDPHTQRQQEPSVFQAYFRERYLRDLTANLPPVFVDGVTPGSFAFADPATQGIESFPALNAVIRAHYSLADEVNGVRIFILAK